jgi:hypothetical protein
VGFGSVGHQFGSSAETEVEPSICAGEAANALPVEYPQDFQSWVEPLIHGDVDAQKREVDKTADGLFRHPPLPSRT